MSYKVLESQLLFQVWNYFFTKSPAIKNKSLDIRQINDKVARHISDQQEKKTKGFI